MTRYKFSDIAINSTAKKKPTVEDSKNYIGLEHLDSGCVSINRYGSKVALTGDKLVMKKGDVLFGRRNAYLKRAAIAPFDGLFSAHGMVLRPKEKVIDKDFFPFFISSDYFMDNAIKISVGSLSPTVNWGTLKNCEFNLPSIEVQKKLAKILLAMQKSIQKKEKALKALIAYIDIMENNYFLLHLDENVMFENRCLKVVADLAEIDPKKPKEMPETVSFVGMKDISENGGIMYSEEKNYEDVKKGYTYFAENDILFAKITPCMENGKGACAKNLINSVGVGSTEFFVLRAKKKCYEQFIYALTISKSFRKMAEDWMHGTAGQKRVSKDLFLLKKIWIPSDEEIVKIGKLFSDVYNFKNALMDKISSEKNSCSQFVNLAIGGQINVQ